MAIQAIETRYHGCRFRSRLEARWAVFFDALDIRWQYEPEGFIGIYEKPYLPDFYLSESGKWIEVKPSLAKLQEVSSVIGQAVDYGATPVSDGLIVLGQIPYGGSYPTHPYFFWNKGISDGWAIFLDDGSIHTEDFGTVSSDILPVSSRPNDYDYWGQSPDLHGTLHGVSCPSRVMDAYVSASSARFEHGEYG